VTTFGRTIVAIVLGVLILFPGVELLRFVVRDLLNIYREMSVTDCLLVFVIMLLLALILQPRGETERRARARREEPDLTLVGNRPPGPPSRTRRTAAGQRHSREPSSRREE
jgi:hypothetical protein